MSVDTTKLREAADSRERSSLTGKSGVATLLREAADEIDALRSSASLNASNSSKVKLQEQAIENLVLCVNAFSAMLRAYENGNTHQMQERLAEIQNRCGQWEAHRKMLEHPDMHRNGA